MVKPNVLILTNEFPNSESKSEIWLLNEINITHLNYNKIYILPLQSSISNYTLPSNCIVLNALSKSNIALSFFEVINSLSIVLSDFKNYASKIIFFKLFRYNFALIRSNYKLAKAISEKKLDINIVYSYWSNQLASIGAIYKKSVNKNVKFISRAHGFDVFENQTHHGVVPFRTFQYQFLNKLFSVSKTGCNYLKNNVKYKHFINKNDFAYLGTSDFGIAPFTNNKFSIVTCSIIRNVKRLELMPEILKHINFDLTWHIIGNGPDFEALKKLCFELPANIKVVYHGEKTNEEVIEIYKQNSFNLLVSLSSSEGLPVSMMEAQSFGVPILSTNVGGCSEICNEETGILISKNFDALDVARIITEFKSSSKNTVQFREKCRTHWEKNFNANENYKNFSKQIINA